MQWKIITGFRFLLAWFIICDHLELFISNPNQDLFYKLKVFTPLGDVIGILLISGYLIGHSITKNPEGFYKRRILRMVPLYVCAILASVLPFLIFGSTVKLANGGIEQPEVGATIGYLLFLQGFVADSFSANWPLWPFGILVFAYLFAPLFQHLNTNVLIGITGFSAALYVGAPHLYEVLHKTEMPYYSKLGYNIFFVLFLWVWLLGFIYYREQEKVLGKVLLFGGCIMLLLNQNLTGKVAIVIYLATCLVLVFAPQIRLPNVMGSILNYFGNIAYPVYLFHIPTFVFANSLLGINKSALLLFLNLLVGMGLYHAIDVPLRFRKVAAQESVG